MSEHCDKCPSWAPRTQDEVHRTARFVWVTLKQSNLQLYKTGKSKKSSQLRSRNQKCFLLLLGKWIKYQTSKTTNNWLLIILETDLQWCHSFPLHFLVLALALVSIISLWQIAPRFQPNLLIWHKLPNQEVSVVLPEFSQRFLWTSSCIKRMSFGLWPFKFPAYVRRILKLSAQLLWSKLPV